MSLHFPLPKIRTFRFSLHTSRLSHRGEVTITALKFATSSHFPLPKIFSPSLFPLFQMARAARRVIENPRQMIKSCPVLFCSSHYYRKRGSTSYIVREVLSVREREREIQTDRERRKWRHHFRAKIHTFPCQKFAIGDELTLSLAKNSHFSFLPSHFPSLCASYIVREVLSVREREIQTDRERETEVTSPLSR